MNEEREERDETTRSPAGEPVHVPEPAPEVPAPEETDPALQARAAIEALLYASGKPFPVEKLAEASELELPAVESALEAIAEDCLRPGRGVRLERVAGGVRLVSRPEFDFPVRRLLGIDGRTKLSMAALETLSIVAYRQPVTAPEISELRGVNSSSSIRTLLERKLLTTAGRKEVVGMPFLYKTTKEFLVHFGLSTLTELPKPEELEALYGVEPSTHEPAQVELFPEPEPSAEAVQAAEAAEAGDGADAADAANAADAGEPTAAAGAADAPGTIDEADREAGAEGTEPRLPPGEES